MDVWIVPTGVPSPTSEPKLRRYEIGKLTVEDKTDHQFSIVSSQYRSDDETLYKYMVYINNKYLVYPACSDSLGQIVFKNSFLIKVERLGTVFKLTAIQRDRITKQIYYVDPEHEVDGRAYDMYPYIPTLLSIEEIKAKVKSFEYNFPHFIPTYAYFNRHGVFVFGKQQIVKDGPDSSSNYFFCWASPQDEKLKYIHAKIRQHVWYTNLVLYSVQSYDQFLSSKINTKSGEAYLNREIAFPLDLSNLTYT